MQKTDFIIMGANVVIIFRMNTFFIEKLMFISHLPITTELFRKTG